MPLRRREALALGTVAVAAGAAGFLAGRLLIQGDTSGEQALTSTIFLDLDDRPRRLSDWTDTVLVVNFWATWCGPCREEIPMLVSAREHYRRFGVEFVGIAIDQASKVIEYSRTTRITYPLLLGEANGIEVLRGLGNKAGGLPYTVVLDRAGLLAHRKLGALHRPELDRMLSSLGLASKS